MHHCYNTMLIQYNIIQYAYIKIMKYNIIRYIVPNALFKHNINPNGVSKTKKFKK